MEANPSEWNASRTYHFLTSVVAPRPIAWVTTVDTDGRTNAAPFSWFQAICADPPMVMLAIARRRDGSEKDTLRNIRATGEFVVNGAVHADIDAMIATAAEMEPGASELDAVGIETVPATAVTPPRIASAPTHLECKLVEIHAYGGDGGTHVVVGEVVHVHAEDSLLDERGSFKPHDAAMLARLGGADYLAVGDVFAHGRPKGRD